MILFRRWLREHDDGENGLAQQAESDPAAANDLLLQVCACACVGEAGLRRVGGDSLGAHSARGVTARC